MISWLNEYFTVLPDERALILGIVQTVPLFKKRFIVCTAVAAAPVVGIGGMWWLSRTPTMGVEVESNWDIEGEVVKG
ncbi:hypothetical protein V8E51_010971 [Hyaloscypha variabilis]